MCKNFILTAVAILFISGCGRAEKIARIEQKCANNEAVWCLKLGKTYARRDINKGVMYYQKACDLGDKRGCYRLAVLLNSKSINSKKDNETIVKSLTKSCDLGTPKACFELGEYYEDDPKMQGKANELFAKSCEQRFGLACYKLADFYGEKNDAATQKSYLELACKYRYKVACEEVGEDKK